jgi:hypothetical protein
MTRAAANGGRQALSFLRIRRVRRLSRRVAPRADATQCRDQDPGGFSKPRRRYARRARRVRGKLRRRHPFYRRYGGLGAQGHQRRRSFAAPTRACGAADRKGDGPGRSRAPHLYAMGSVARDRLQPKRREEEPRYRHAGLRCEPRRKVRANGCYARVPGRSSQMAQRDQFLSREAVHQRRQSCRARFRVCGPGRP